MVKHTIRASAFDESVYFKDTHPFSEIPINDRKNIKSMFEFIRTTAKQYTNIPVDSLITATYFNTGKRSVSIENSKFKFVIKIEKYKFNLLIIDPDTNKPFALIEDGSWSKEMKPIIVDLFNLAHKKSSWSPQLKDEWFAKHIESFSWVSEDMTN